MRKLVTASVASGILLSLGLQAPTLGNSQPQYVPFIPSVVCAESDSYNWNRFVAAYLVASFTGSDEDNKLMFSKLSTVITGTKSKNLRTALQKLDSALVANVSKGIRYTRVPQINDAYSAVDGIIKFDRCDPQSGTQSGSATSSDKITLKVKRTAKGVTISGKASRDAGELTLWTKSKGSSIWNSQKVKIRFRNSGTFSANLRLAKNDLPLFMRVQQEGTGSFSNQAVVSK